MKYFYKTDKIPPNQLIIKIIASPTQENCLFIEGIDAKTLVKFECKLKTMLIALRTILENEKGKVTCIAEGLKKLQSIGINFPDINVKLFSTTAW